MHVSLFCHPDDIAADLDLATLKRSGLSRLIVNVLYHDWSCWAPLSRRTPFRREFGGASAVPVGNGHPAGLRPAQRGAATTIAGNAREHGLETDAWTVALHRDDLARRPEAASSRLLTVDAFGTQLATWACPSSIEAENYLQAHLGDIAGTGDFRRIVIEGGHYPLLQHGGAHERDLSRIPSPLGALLELCFCSACQNAMVAAGHDPEKLRADVAQAVRADAATMTADPRLSAMRDLRRRRISDLFAKMQVAVPDHELICADQPAIAGVTFRTGSKSVHNRRDLHASVGFDVAHLASSGVKIMCLAYFRSPDDVAEHIRAYLDEGIPASRLVVALRPGYPDNYNLADLTGKVAVLRDLGIEDVAFYELTQLDPVEWNYARAAIELAAAA